MSPIRMSTDGPGRRVWLFDAAITLWVVAWLVVGVLVGIDLNHLGGLARTLGSTGQALSQTSQALQGFSRLPVVGSHIASAATRLAVSGQGLQADAATTRASVNQLSYLLAVVIAIVPSVPVLAAYLPRRLGSRRPA